MAQIQKVPNADGENRKWDLDMEKHPERLTDGDSPWVEASLTSALVGANCFVCKELSFHSVTMLRLHAKS